MTRRSLLRTSWATESVRTVLDFALYGLIAAALAPLILLGVYVALSHLKAPFAERILDALMGAFSIQMVVGAAVNVLGGLLFCALALWAVSRPDPNVLAWISGGLVLLLGVWRLARGLSLAWAMLAKPGNED